MISFDISFNFIRVFLPVYYLMKRMKLFYKKYMWERKVKLQYQNRFSKNYYNSSQNTFILDLMVKYMGSPLGPLLANTFII